MGRILKKIFSFFRKKSPQALDDVTKARITESLKSEFFNTDLYSFDEAYRKRISDASYSKLVNFLRQSKRIRALRKNIYFQ